MKTTLSKRTFFGPWLPSATFLLFVAWTIVVTAGGDLFAQGAAQKESNLLVGTVAADPGTTATLPVYYKPSAGQKLHKVHLDIEFVSNSIKFTKAEKGVATDTQDYDLSVNAEPLPPDDKNIKHTRLTIDVSIPDSAQGKAIPEGLLTFLDFDVPTDAKSFSISMTPSNLSAEDVAKKSVKLTAEAGKLIVSVPDAPLAGCFFFTH